MAKILVIDDSSFQRRSICGIIESGGHETAQAKNGLEGLEILSKDTFDCIFCDLLMPEMDGNEFLKALKDKGSEHPPVVILTADKQSTSVQNAMDLGAAKYLNKPPQLSEINNIIQELVKK